jgi:hypothetical protein
VNEIARHERSGGRPGFRFPGTWAVLVLAMVLWSPGALAFGAPANDSFVAALSLSGNPATASGNNFDATSEPGEPSHAGQAGGHSVWWAWAAPASGSVSINACGSDFDTVLAVYTGSSVGALVPVVSNDDACLSQSSVTFNAQGGQVYRIAVDGAFGETGNIRLALSPALTVRALTVQRRHRIDATRLFIEAAAAGDELPDVPSLRFERGRTRVVPDLDIDNEIDSADDTRFRYTFAWSCGRGGVWRWTVSMVRGGTRVSQQGSFSVPGCVTRGWFVSRATVVRGFAADFGRQAARYLRCQPAGARRGSRAATWRCRIFRPGLVCRGGFVFHYTRTFQGADLVASRRAASGGATCRG